MRTYTEQEVADIIARAAERQAAAARAPSREGLTLDEIERIGTEAGLDPADLRAAAAEVDVAGRTLTRQTSQTKTSVVVERWIDAPLTLEGWENTVDVLREQLGASAMAAFGLAAGGAMQQVGAAYEWTHTSGLGIQTTVTASPRGERTRLRMSQVVGMGSPRAEGIAYGLGLAMLVAGIVAAALVKGDVAMLTVLISALATFAGTLAVGIPVTTALDRRWRDGKLRTLDALADDLSSVLAAPSSFASEREAAPSDRHAATEPAATEARLSLDALGDDLTAASAAAPSRIRS